MANSAISPIEPWENLEQVYQYGWMLSTSQLRDLVGTKPTKNGWRRGSFVFWKAGRIGRETAWQIEKVLPTIE